MKSDRGFPLGLCGVFQDQRVRFQGQAVPGSCPTPLGGPSTAWGAFGGMRIHSERARFLLLSHS